MALSVLCLTQIMFRSCWFLMLMVGAQCFLSLRDDEACVAVGDPPITRVMDASVPVRFDSPGFNFSDPEGSAYPDNMHCQWQINLNDSNQNELMLSFRNFSLEYATDCRFDRVEVRDVDESGPVLLTWCSGVVPEPVITSSGSLFVMFHSNDNGIGGAGFLARAGYRFENTACESPQVFDSTVGIGVFSSEEYPLPYRHNSDCQYHFIAPPGKRVQLSFANDFETRSICCFCDVLNVLNGGDADARLAAEFFGNQWPAQVRSASEELYLHFTSDETVTAGGFFGWYRFVDAPQQLQVMSDDTANEKRSTSTTSKLTNGTVACDPALRPVVITDPGTVITSPNYPAQYPNNQVCEYYMQSPPNRNVKVTFTDFFLEECLDCSCDRVDIYAGANDSAPLAASICGNLGQGEYKLGAEAFIRFVSDGTASGSGFSATIPYHEDACVEGGIVISEPSGMLTTDGYPGYPVDSECVWHFILPNSSYVVELMFHDLWTFGGCTGAYYYDYILFLGCTAGECVRYALWHGPYSIYMDGMVFSSYPGVEEVKLTLKSGSGGPLNGFNLTYAIVMP